MIIFVERQIAQIRQGGLPVLSKKIIFSFRVIGKSIVSILAIPMVLVIRLIRPWLLVRWGNFYYASRIGHFANNTELYLCERDADINRPKLRCIDIFFMEPPISNWQLAKMWKRHLHIWPYWILSPLCNGNRIIPGGEIHEIGNNTQYDRDVHNLLDRFPPHLYFTAEEDAGGKAGLAKIGIPEGASFVCLIVRDSAYLEAHLPDRPNCAIENDFRDSDIQSYMLAAEELASRGYFVIRMGAKVRSPMKTSNPMIIDYATNGMRSDFMDIYLGAKCTFCISVSTGFDAIPNIFRRPIAYVNMVPLGYLFTFRDKYIGITKHHYAISENRELSLSEIFTSGVSVPGNPDYTAKGVRLVDNTPEEIRDLVVEMDERLRGTWRPQEDDEELQRRFWDIYSKNAATFQAEGLTGSLHGEIRARFGAGFLRTNRWWIQ